MNAVRDFAIFAIAGLSGARVSEVLGVRVRDLTLAADPPYVRVERRKKKKPTTHDVALPPTAARAAREFLRSLRDDEKTPDCLLFPLTVRSAQRLFKHYCAIAGLSPAYSFHALRHYRGLTLYEEHRDLELVREALGHSSLASTQVYVHTLDHLKKTALTDVDLGDAP